nr:RNA-directed DNA polymerase, eukaryota, reverse transcriptase zinc-binding domain protein [Tanacetum cinerariifolium]GFA47346.1 RNA-directed DNA polymerase, eukaryota, reverse transcriptase zinc-binding domain protein [Tanacetum cinerariifolium]
RRKEASVMERGGWVDNRWVWEWDWTKDIRGRVCKEFKDLLGVLQHVIIYNNCRDQWRWLLDEDGEFTVKELSKLVEENILCSNNEGQEMLWNKLVPKKVNVGSEMVLSEFCFSCLQVLSLSVSSVKFCCSLCSCSASFTSVTSSMESGVMYASEICKWKLFRLQVVLFCLQGYTVPA